MFFGNHYQGKKMSSKAPKQEYSDIEQSVDIEEFRESVLAYFSTIPDPRRQVNLTYRLEHVFFIILAAILAGANSIKQIALFAKTKAQWIKNFIDIDSIPTYGTYWWILVRIKPEFLRELLKGWLGTLPKELRDQVLAMDGKCLRGTQNSSNGNSVLHLVSLFAAESGVVLVQQPVENKSNEITAIPTVLDQINIEGAIITSDAMGCQKSISTKICDGGADYIFALKGNQGSLADEVENYFNQAEAVHFEGIECDALGSRETGHGRIEQREIYVTEDIDWLPQKGEWKNLKSIIMIKSKVSLRMMCVT